jgi:hypothetical protein
MAANEDALRFKRVEPPDYVDRRYVAGTTTSTEVDSVAGSYGSTYATVNAGGRCVGPMRLPRTAGGASAPTRRCPARASPPRCTVSRPLLMSLQPTSGLAGAQHQSGLTSARRRFNRQQIGPSSSWVAGRLLLGRLRVAGGGNGCWASAVTTFASRRATLVVGADPRHPPGRLDLLYVDSG